MDECERDDWQRADRVLDALLDVPPDQRNAHLEALALPDAVRARVERLLAAVEQTEGVLDQPGPLPPMPDALDGRRLGRWLLEKEIGRGGMAIVYQAHSVEGPTGQSAAIKVLTIGALAAAGAERFLHEQRALLRMRHPYIATLYDAGIADDGTAWLAMARVDGEAIDSWCERKGLDLRARIRLVLQVGEALAYAHRNLVIHRDIKPSNVLVDEDGHVRLLDFGIARCADAIDSDRQRTATVLRALTPGYAAPEQFTGATPATAMDVFGLGALLYHLLTGMAPRTGRDGAEEITAPSRTGPTTVATGDAGKDWSRQVRGDLDAIVMKALAHEPEARYASIDAFGHDLERWLAGKPVKAKAPTLRYRVGKFVSRNRIGVLASLLLLVVLAAGVAGTVWQAREARQQAALAQQQAILAKQQAQRATAVRDFLADVFTSTDPSDGDMPNAMDLLNEGSRRARTLTEDSPLIAADILLISGGARIALNDLEGAETDILLSLDLLDKARPAPAPALSQAHWSLGRLYKMRGLQQQSLQQYREAVRWTGRWDAPAEVRLVRESSLASALITSGHAAQSEQMLRQILAKIPAAGLADTQLHLDTLNALGLALTKRGASLEEMIEIHEQRLQIARGLYGEDNGWYAYTLADSVPTLRKSPAHLDRAEQAARQAVAITTRIYNEPHMFAAVAACNLAALLVQRGKRAEALHYYDVDIAIDEALERNDPHAESCRYGRANARFLENDPRGALEDLEKDRAMLEVLDYQRSALWLRNCALQAQIMQPQQSDAAVDAFLERCERDHAPLNKPLPPNYLQARARLDELEPGPAEQ